jgi:hypothetical protein
VTDIVLGLGTSHTPQLSVPWQQWALLREKDEQDSRLDYTALLDRAKPNIETELTPEVWQRRADVCRDALSTLRDMLADARPDVVVIVGDDQREQFLDDNMPTFCLYRGASMLVKRRSQPGSIWAMFEDGLPEAPREFPGCPDLAEHMIRSLVCSGFDLSTSNQLRDGVGLGHAFHFLYRKLLRPDLAPIPMVPVMSNTYNPPNQPTPARCYDFGLAVREAISSWDTDARVALIASGGLSHVVVDEALDRTTLEALQQGDRSTLVSLPTEKLNQGTSEIRNWISVGAALRDKSMTLIAYEPCYRSPAGTGCGMAFASWT